MKVTTIEDPKNCDEIIFEIVDHMLPQLEVMSVEQIRDNILNAIDMFVKFKYYRTVTEFVHGLGDVVRERQMGIVPDKYSKLVQYINYLYDTHMKTNSEVNCRNAFMEYCYEVKLRDEGLSATLKAI